MLPAHTIALVACGGQSSRMGTDKGLINYHGLPQRYHLYRMLSGFCTDVFLAVSPGQSGYLAAGYRFIADLPRYAGSGPMAALLSAAEIHPGNPFLLIGTDYPFLHAKELASFLQVCRGEKPAAFMNPATGFFEPLLAWYPVSSIAGIQQQWRNGAYSLQAFLREQDAIPYIPEDINCIRSVDDPSARDEALQKLQD